MNPIDFKHKVFSLSERLFPMVARMLGNSESAEDAIQEIMIKLWDRRKQIGQHPNINGFVFLTARNYCIDLLKKKKLETLGKLSPDDIENIKIVKDEQAMEKYNAPNGVIIVTTKIGKK